MSSNKTPKGRAGNSPVKSRTQKAVVEQQNDGSEYIVIDKDLVRGLSEKEVEIEHLKTIVVALQEKVVVIEDIKVDVATHKVLFQQSEVKREELQIHITETSVVIREDTQQHNGYEQTLIEETQKLQSEIQALKQHQAKREQEHLQKLEQINQTHNSSVESLNKDHSDKVSTLNQEHHTKVDNLQKDHHQQVTQMSSDFHNRLETEQREAKAKHDQLFAEKEAMRQDKDLTIRTIQDEKELQRDTYENRINELDQQIKQHQRTILTLNSTIIELKEIITQKLDVEDQLQRTREHLTQIDEQKNKLQIELETASDYIIDLEDKVYRANKTSLELLRQLKDAEVEIETLKNYIIELKQRIAVYIPMKDDVIDRKLAEFINNYPERQKLKIMFMRESEGVYQFGTKRVAVRVDKDKINIRVGGGYLSIDEFLDQYTPGELEKLERKDPLKKFSEKVAIQKTIIGREIRESSPVRSPERNGNQSPKRF